MRKINPNWLTASRIVVFAPLVLVLLCLNSPVSLACCLAAMLMAELTDLLDGKLARATGQVTDLGKIFDPLCDSVYHGTIWLGFLWLGWLPIWLAPAFFVRDQIVAYIRVYLASKQFVMAARQSGKIKAVSQATAQIAVVILHIALPNSELSRQIGLGLICVAAVITLYSLADYFQGFRQKVSVGSFFNAAA